MLLLITLIYDSCINTKSRERKDPASSDGLFRISVGENKEDLLEDLKNKHGKIIKNEYYFSVFMQEISY